MAAGILPKPGARDFEDNELLCIGDCSHTDCNYTKRMANTNCRICKKPIGYDTRFYQEDNYKQLVHSRCIEE